jgi:peptidoglycan/LPS O-acetylase OafA/YrhL
LNDRKTGIDLARTLAIFAVVYVHTVEIQSAAYGVQLFFMISGYLLADSHIHYSSTQFIFVRFFRLFPLSVLLVLIYIPTFDSNLEVIVSLLLLNGFFTAITSFPGGWSISSEWIYSLTNIWIVRLQTKGRVKLLTSLTLLGMLTDAIEYIHPGFIGKFHALLYLMIFFTFYLVGNLLKTNPRIIQSNFLGKKFSLFLFLIPLLGINLALPKVFYLLSLSLLFASCLRQDYWPTALISIFHFFGKRTFGMFIGHFIIMAYLESIADLQWLTSSSSAGVKLCYFATIFLTSAILGTASYALVERPLAKFAHKRVNKRRT